METPPPRWRASALVALLLAWLVAQALAVDLDAVFSGFGLGRARSDHHHGYALANVGAWLVTAVAASIFVFQRGRWRSALLAIFLGGGAAVLQFSSVIAASGLLLDPRQPVTIETILMRLGPSAMDSAAAAAASTALLAVVAAAIGYVAGQRGGSIITGTRHGAIALARSLHPRNFNVFSWLFGPVFQADVRVTGRRRGTYVARSMYLLILLGIVSIAWFAMRSDLHHYSGAERLRRMQELAPSMAMPLVWTQFILLLFIAPLLTAPVICQERTGRTLPALLTTPLTSAQIVFGKLAGRLMMAIVLILLSVPLLLGIRVYGGLDTAFVLKAVAVTISATIFAASLGLLASIWSKRATTAAVMAFLMLAAHSVAIPLIIGFILVQVTNAPPDWVFALSPFMSLILLTAEAAGDPAPFASGNVWKYDVLFNLGFAAAACLLATIAFRRVMVAEAQGQTVTLKRRKRRPAKAGNAVPVDAATPPSTADGQELTQASGLQTPLPPAEDGSEELIERESREIGDNPVRWREIRQTSLGGGSMARAVIIVTIAVVAVLLLNLYVGPSEEGLHFVIVACGMMLFGAGAAVAAAGSVAGEREAGSWPILLTTPLSGLEILTGKFLGACRRCWIAPALLLLDVSIAVAADAFRPVVLLHLAVIMAAAIVFLCGTGTLFSTLCRKTTMAGVANLALAVCLWLGLPMFLGFLMAVTGAEPDEQWVFTGAFSINPVAMSVFALAGAESPAYPGRQPYEMFGGELGVVGFTILLFVGMGVLAVAGVVSLGLAAARLTFGPERTS